MSQIILCNKSLEYDDILTFCEDTSQEYIYYGTDGTGLIRRSLVTDSYEKIATPANIVVDLSIDSQKPPMDRHLPERTAMLLERANQTIHSK